MIPASARSVVDCRLLPGQHPEHVEPIVRAVLGGDVDYELEWVEPEGGTRSPLDTPLWRRSSRSSSESSPARGPSPICTAGFTDSHWLREAFGTVAYGFFPMTGAMPMEVVDGLVHSADERIPIADLELGVDWLRHAALTVLA